MSGFRSFFIGSVTGKAAVPLNNDDVGSEKWDVVLFVGNYDPITKDEYTRIKQFVAKVIKGDQAHKFSHDVDVGVLINEQLDEESYFEEKQNYSLTFEDKEFIAGKLFGLRIFPVNFKQLMWLTLDVLDQNASESSKEKIEKIVTKIQSSFEKANILIVLREDDSHSLEAIGEIIHKFSNKDINIGFMAWHHEPVKNAMMDNIPFSGDLIKAVCLMDFDRPDPDELKTFSYKYRLSKHLDTIRGIHLKVQGEKYLLPFTSLFPDLVIYGDEEFEDKKNNYIFVMEMLKKMYLGDAYENRIDSHDDKKPKVVKNTGTTAGGAGPGPSAGGGSSAGPESSPDNSSAETDLNSTEAGSTEPTAPKTSTPETPEIPT